MLTTLELLDEINQKVHKHVNTMKKVKPEQLGLDSRAGYTLFICDESIAVKKHNDRALQYYGGFEYIDKTDRIEIGDYVFYFNDDRVINAIEKLEC